MHERPNPKRSLLMAFVTESTLAIYRQWVADGKQMTPERLANLAVKPVCKGALQQLNSLDARPHPSLHLGVQMTR